MRVKIDIHTNLGYVPDTKRKASQELYIPPIRLAEFLRKFEITHTVVLYWEYRELEELQKMVPEIKLYGVKWVLDVERATAESMDCDLPLNYGIKLHSHRCFIERDGEKIYGLDYSNKLLLAKALDHLPDNKVVYMHTQGSASLQSMASPRSIYSLSLEYPNLKFIIGHMGAFGKGSMKPIPKYFKPVTRKKITRDQRYYFNLHKSFVFHSMLVQDAVFIANNTRNVFLDTSIGYPIKDKVLRGCNKWGIGSDYPFTHVKVNDWENHSYDYQLRLFQKFTSIEEVEKSHQNTIDFLEKDLVNTRDKRWYAFFSRSGNELCQLILRTDQLPYRIITNKSLEDLQDLNIYHQYKDIIEIIPNNPTAQQYKDALEGYQKNFDFVTLHGYLRILPKSVVHRIDAINLHPGLITKYPELKGLDPQKRVWERFTEYSSIGCVLHKVIAEVDEGEVLLEVEEKGEVLSQIYKESILFDRLGELALKLWIEYLTKKLETSCESEFAEQEE